MFVHACLCLADGDVNDLPSSWQFVSITNIINKFEVPWHKNDVFLHDRSIGWFRNLSQYNLNYSGTCLKLNVPGASALGVPGPTDVKSESLDISWISRLKQEKFI